MGKHFWLILGILLLAGAATELWWSNYGITVSRYDIRSDALPADFDGYKIVHLSDLHSASIGRNNSRLLDAIIDQKPDIIVMTGDMVSRYDKNFNTAIHLVQSLAEKFPVYYIPGNHEEGLENDLWENLCTALLGCGVTVLNNEAVRLTSENGEFINLIGLWYNLSYYHEMTQYYTPFTDETMNKILGDAPEGYNLLLAHNPNNFDVYARWGADLTLSGHIHGGMIRLPLIGGILSPETLMFPRYDGGLYESGNAKMILSRGLGRGSMGLRLFNPPEVVSITLHSDKQGGT